MKRQVLRPMGSTLVNTNAVLATTNIKRISYISLIILLFQVTNLMTDELYSFSLMQAGAVILTVLSLGYFIYSAFIYHRRPLMPTGAQWLSMSYWIVVMLGMIPYFIIDILTTQVPINVVIVSLMLAVVPIISRRESAVLISLFTTMNAGFAIAYDCPPYYLITILAVGATGFMLSFFIQQQYMDIIMQLDKEATTDRLTGILNENGFLREGANCILHKGYDVCIQIDVQNFKFYNNKYGITAGDELLRHLSAFLATQYPDAVFARISSDHFILLTQWDEGMVSLFRSKLRGFLCGRMNPGIVEDIGLFFGVYRMEGGQESIHSIFSKSGIALKKAKEPANGMTVFFEERLIDELRLEAQIADQFHEAMANGEFSLFIQPIIEMGSGDWEGVEVLARWQSAEFGDMNPDLFIPIAEKNGFVAEIDFYVLEQVLLRYQGMLDQGWRPIPAAVNQSRVTLLQPDYVQRVQKLIKQYEVSPSLIQIEVTESVMASNLTLLLEVVHQLRHMGFVISMDDFGKEYSSLNLLQIMNMDILKIDCSLLHNIKGSALSYHILSAVIDAAQKGDVKVICEGVETAEQDQMLREMRCQYVQGYFYQRPTLWQESDERLIDDSRQPYAQYAMER